MPQRGPGSLAPFGRRLVAVLVDWFVCNVIAAGFLHYVLLVGTLGSTMGHRLLGLRVVRLGGAGAGPLLAVIRTVLLALVIPAAIWDRDTRGFHDKMAGTVLVRI
jgi:uncharacterized RDD family membrane protein YckC